MNTALKVAGILVLIVTVLLALVWVFQRSLVFLPDKTDPGSATDRFDYGQDVTLSTADGLELSAWLISPEAAVDREMGLLYAPGNGGNRAGRIGIAQQLADAGFTVLLMDYRGYGGNPGSPSEEGLANDAVAGVDALTDLGFAAENTIYFGESIGTGVVARLQDSHPPGGVVLRSPFPDFAAVAGEHYPYLPVQVLLRDRFETVEYLQDSQVPTTVVYGSADNIVPAELSAAVATEAGNLHEELVLQGVGHNDAPMFGQPVVDAAVQLASE